jgi:hypothetical protein
MRKVVARITEDKVERYVVADTETLSVDEVYTNELADYGFSEADCSDIMALYCGGKSEFYGIADFVDTEYAWILEVSYSGTLNYLRKKAELDYGEMHAILDKNLENHYFALEIPATDRVYAELASVKNRIRGEFMLRGSDAVNLDIVRKTISVCNGSGTVVIPKIDGIETLEGSREFRGRRVLVGDGIKRVLGDGFTGLTVVGEKLCIEEIAGVNYSVSFEGACYFESPVKITGNITVADFSELSINVKRICTYGITLSGTESPVELRLYSSVDGVVDRDGINFGMFDNARLTLGDGLRLCGHSLYGSLTELILDGEIATLDEESPFSGSIERVVITEKCKELPPYLFYGLSIGSIEILPRETPLYIGACALTTKDLLRTDGYSGFIGSVFSNGRVVLREDALNGAHISLAVGVDIACKAETRAFRGVTFADTTVRVKAGSEDSFLFSGTEFLSCKIELPCYTNGMFYDARLIWCRIAVKGKKKAIDWGLFCGATVDVENILDTFNLDSGELTLMPFSIDNARFIRFGSEHFSGVSLVADKATTAEKEIKRAEIVCDRGFTVYASLPSTVKIF